MNPFLPWLPMYAPGAVPERPWWRALDVRGYVRVDGAQVIGSEVHPWLGYVPGNPNPVASVEGYPDEGEWGGWCEAMEVPDAG